MTHDWEKDFELEFDEVVRRLISPEDLNRSPERFAALYGHRYLCFGLHRYRYRDPELGTWVRRLAEIIFDKDEMERCRRELLSQDELRNVRQEIADEKEES